MTDFNSFGLQKVILQALTNLEFTTPTPIQSQAIPLALEGKDILGTAGTGTGKTGAFGLPMISHLLKNPKDVALVMTPTRELAVQVMASLSAFIGVDRSFRTALLIGGQEMRKQLNQLRHSPRLIVGTPGRINDHIQRGTFGTKYVKFLVLDEADRMLDMGFGVQIDKILENVPEERQTLLFSATLPNNIMRLTNRYQKNPERVSVGSVTEPAKNVKQETIHLSSGERYGELITQLNKRDGSVIVFVKTKSDANQISKKLRDKNHETAAIHGDLKHTQRARVITAFRNRENRILIATDIAARGLDIPHIEHVINYDLPHSPEDYIHRIGRTGRAGADGEAVNLVTPADNRRWRAICKLINHETDGTSGPDSEFSKPKKPKKSKMRRDGARASETNEDGFRDRSNFGEKREFRQKREFGSRKPYGEKKSYNPADSDLIDTPQTRPQPREEYSRNENYREEYRPREERRPREDRSFREDRGSRDSRYSRDDRRPRNEDGSRDQNRSRNENRSGNENRSRGEYRPREENNSRTNGPRSDFRSRPEHKPRDENRNYGDANPRSEYRSRPDNGITVKPARSKSKSNAAGKPSLGTKPRTKRKSFRTAA